MRIMILGAAGYLGWPTAMHFSNRGHDVACVDNMVKWKWEDQIGVRQLEPRLSLSEKAERWEVQTDLHIDVFHLDIAYEGLHTRIMDWGPNVVIHYAEQPSAPFSMMGRAQCRETAANNVLGTLNVLWALKGTDIHLVKLGTMGEYGTPNIDIEEGWLHVEHNGREDRVLYPKQPPSWYHASKVADSTNLEFACRAWGLRATDLNQGIVYGTTTDETGIIPTSFHYDGVFGTALNRFIAQSVAGHPLTVYGTGGQVRGWLNIRDTLACVELACHKPPERGEFRVFNQFTEQWLVYELAVQVASLFGGEIKHIQNPRVEKEEHYYNAKHTALLDLGLEPHLLTDDVLGEMYTYVERYRDRINVDQLMPKVKWR